MHLKCGTSSKNKNSEQKKGHNFLPISKNEAFLCFIGRVYLRGKLNVTLLSGNLECLGSKFTKYQSYNVYSPKGYSLLYLEASLEDQLINVDEVITNLKSILEDSVHAIQTLELNIDYIKGSNCVSLAYVRRIDEPWICYVEKHIGPLFRDISWPNFSSCNATTVSETIELELNAETFMADEATDRYRLYVPEKLWDNVVNDAQRSLQSKDDVKILVAGGKGVGKSTFLRFMINKLIASTSVIFIDLDPGQSEFNIPGCISCTRLTSPVLGPNFTHLKGNITEGSDRILYVGHINVADSLHYYMVCLKELMHFCCSTFNSNDEPWLINTMGFNRGLGETIIMETIRSIRPTTVVELRSRFNRKNYSINLSAPSISSHFGTAIEVLNYSLIKFQAIPESMSAQDMRSKDRWGMPEPAKLRDISILSYIAQYIVPIPAIHLNLSNVPARRLNWEHVGIQLLHTEDVTSTNVLRVLNASLVSLGRVSEDDLPTKDLSYPQTRLVANYVITDSLGFGIIRGIDPILKCFYIITSLPITILHSVNCLSVGNIHLPESLLLTGTQANAPYVTKCENNPLDGPWKRHHKPIDVFQGKIKRGP